MVLTALLSVAKKKKEIDKKERKVAAAYGVEAL